MARRVVLIFVKYKDAGLRRIGATGKLRMPHMRDLPVVQQLRQINAQGEDDSVELDEITSDSISFARRNPAAGQELKRHCGSN